MREFINKRVIFWDFDGVILDSSEVREEGFKTALQSYSTKEVNELLEFHRINGGLSRYYKFRYFLEKIRGEKPDNQKITLFSTHFSEIMRKSLTNKDKLIKEVFNFISRNYSKYDMHIVSGSDQEELRFLCRELGISHYFKSVVGSPATKETLISNILTRQHYDPSDCILIGDSINDFDAAIDNDVDFYGYNNPSLKKIGNGYLESFY